MSKIDRSKALDQWTHCPKCGEPPILLNKRYVCSNPKCNWSSK